MNRREAEFHLQNLRAFHATESFYAIEGQVNGHLGQLPAEWQERYIEDCKLFGIKYTVMSYLTPIGWVAADEVDNPVFVVIPDVFYSRTTCKPQASCREHLPFPGKRVTSL